MGTPAQGYNAYAGLKKESVYGAIVVADDFVEFESEAINQDEQWQTLNVINNSRYQHKRVKGNTKVGGSFNFPINVDDGIGSFLKDVLGAETYALVDSCGSHTFVPQAATGLTGLSMEISRDNAAHSTNIFGFAGGHVESLTITGEAGQPLKCAVELSFASGVYSITVQVPSYSTQLPLMFHTGTILVDAAAFEMKSFQLKIQPALRERYAGNSRSRLQSYNGPLEVSGQFTTWQTGMAEIAKYIAGTAAALSIDVTGATIGTVTVSRLKLDMATVFYDKNLPVVGGPDEIILTHPFRSINATASNVLTALLVNTVAAAY